jgi:flagellin
MVINTNTTAINAADTLQMTQSQMSESLSRLSSGQKIINPADDAGGLATANRLDAQIKRLDAAKTDVGNAVSYTQTQDGYLKSVNKALSRMSELAVLAQDVTKTDTDRKAYVSEFAQLNTFLSDASSKTFNNVSLFQSNANTMDVPIDSEGSLFLTMNGIDLDADVVSVVSGADISTISTANTALDSIKQAITNCSQDRATIGAYQSRLNYSSEQLTVGKENLTAASSRIQDVDIAEESTNLARNNVLQQAGTAMLAQANQMPQGVLKLLNG